MTYTPQTWNNNDSTTPISAARLNYIEAGIAAAAAAPTNLTLSQGGTSTLVSATATDTTTGAQAASFKTFAGGGTAHVHALTAYTTGSGNGFSSAANLVSDNSAASCVQVSGTESGRGTIKTAHLNPGPLANTDANASALSIDLQNGGFSGTAAQGIFIDATTGGTTGKLLNIRNNGNTIFNIVPKTGNMAAALETHNTQARFSDGVATATNAGTVSDGSFTNGAADGLIAVDTTNGIIYTRSGGAWYGDPIYGGNDFQPQDHGMISWTTDPGYRLGANAVTAGNLNLNRLNVRYPVTASNLYVNIGTAGTGVTPLANCFVALYNSAGTQVGFSSDQSTPWASTGTKQISLTATTTGSLNLTAGFYWAAILVGTQSTTNVTFSENNVTAAMANANLTAATYRAAVNGTGLSALTGSITPASNSQTGFTAYYWIGLS